MIETLLLGISYPVVAYVAFQFGRIAEEDANLRHHAETNGEYDGL